MDNKNITPEERLLRLIKEDNKAKPKGTADAAQISMPAPAQSAPPVQSSKKFLKRWAPANEQMQARNINKALFTVLSLVVIYTIYDFSVFILPRLSKVSMEKGYVDTLEPKKTSLGSPQHKEQALQPVAYYTEDIQKKDLFKPSLSENREGPADSQSIQSDKAKLADLAANLSLKGIIDGQPPQAVIEDKKQAKTFFVTSQEKVGEVIIDQITDKKVRLRLGEETADLML